MMSANERLAPWRTLNISQLKEGVEAWNQWRRDNPKTAPNLSMANLYRANLSGADLSKVRLSVQTLPGKAIRLLTTTGIGSIPPIGLIAGFVASAVDTFLLEKMLPKSGVVAFLSNLYPSVFERERK